MIHEHVHGRDDAGLVTKVFAQAGLSGTGKLKCLLVRASDQGMGMMVAGMLTGTRTQQIRSHNGRKETDLFVTIANMEYEVSGQDIVRLYGASESYDVFMLAIGNVGRFSVTETALEATNLLDLS